MKDMSLEESNEAMKKVLENAQELLGEATILLDNQRFAQSLFISPPCM